MHGPFPPGQLSAPGLGDFGHLRVGRRYTVIRAFADHDGALHPIGEEWVFLGHGFVPYHDGLSLFVSLDGVREWQIRLW